MYDLPVLESDWHTAFTGHDWEDIGPIRFAVVGIGSFVKDSMLPAFAASRSAVPEIFVTSSPEEVEPLAEEYDITEVISYDGFDNGVGTNNYDAAYIATPNTLHLSPAKSAAKHGKDVLCEKPLAGTVESAREIVASCCQHDVSLCTAYRVRVKPSIVWARNALEKGYIGDPVQIHSDASFNLLENGPSNQWRTSEELAGGGALVDIGVYPLNTIRYLLDSDPIAVEAREFERGTLDEVDEHISFRLDCPNDVTAQCSVNYQAAPTNQLRIIGTEGELTIDWPYTPTANAEIRLRRGNQVIDIHPNEANELVELLNYFATIVDGDTSEIDTWGGCFDLAAIEAVYEAAGNNSRITISR